MFSNLKTAFQNITSKEKNQDEYEGEDIQAVIILLLEACQIDGDTGKDELEYIKKLLVHKFNFTSDQAEKNLLKALEKSDERIEIFSQIKIILNEMNHEERIDVIEMMWGVILSNSSGFHSFTSIKSPPFDPPKGTSTKAHLYVIKAAKASTSSWFTAKSYLIPPLTGSK